MKNIFNRFCLTCPKAIKAQGKTCGKCLYCVDTHVSPPTHVILAKDHINGKDKLVKKFGYIERKDLCQWLKTVKPENRVFYEMIPPNVWRKIGFDIDGDCQEGETEQQFVDIINELFKVVKRKLGQHLTKDDIKTVKMYVLNANGFKKGKKFKKYSYHVIFNVAFPNVDQWKAFCNSCIDKMIERDADCEEYLDKSIYSSNRQMRMINCTKYGETRHIMIDKNFKQKINISCTLFTNMTDCLKIDQPKLVPKPKTKKQRESKKVSCHKFNSLESYDCDYSVLDLVYKSLPKKYWSTYEYWRDNAMAGCIYTNGSEKGFKLFDKYSKLNWEGGEEISNAEEWAKYKDGAPDKAIKMGTLIKRVRETKKNFLLTGHNKYGMDEDIQMCEWDLMTENEPECKSVENVKEFTVLTDGGLLSTKFNLCKTHFDKATTELPSLDEEDNEIVLDFDADEEETEEKKKKDAKLKRLEKAHKEHKEMVDNYVFADYMKLRRKNKTKRLHYWEIEEFAKATTFRIVNGGNEYWLTKNRERNEIVFNKVDSSLKFSKIKFTIYNPKYNPQLPSGQFNQPTKEISLFNVMDDISLDRYYEREEFIPLKELPDKPKYQNVFNTYTGLEAEKLEPTGHELDPEILEFVKVVAPNHYCDYVLNWMAHFVQYPNKKMPCLIFFSEEQGCGKSTLAEWFAHKIVGLKNSKVGDLRKVLHKFNSLLDKNLLFVFNEGKAYSAGHSEIEQFKALITDKPHLMEGKGDNIVQIFNYSKFILTTNSTQVIKIVPNDRRFALIEVSDEKKQDEDYFTMIRKKLKDPKNIRAFYDMLMARDISDWKKEKLPYSKVKQEIVEQSKPMVVRFMEDWYEKGKFNYFIEEKKVKGKNEPELWVRIPTSCLYSKYKDWINHNAMGTRLIMTEKSFKGKIKKEYGSKPVKFDIDGKKKSRQGIYCLASKLGEVPESYEDEKEEYLEDSENPLDYAFDDGL